MQEWPPFRGAENRHWESERSQTKYRGTWVETVGVFQQAMICLQHVERELLLFTAFWLLVSAADEAVMDLCWLTLLLRGKARSTRLPAGLSKVSLSGRSAVLVAAWQEEQVIGHTLRHALSAWKHKELCLYVGCYANDAATLAAAMAGAGQDTRVRVIIHSEFGPTTKADCLNRLYKAVCEDERRSGIRFRSVVLHDSEDMVHSAELAVIDRALDDADFIQLPVRPEPQASSRWVGGHYIDEFAEAHGKALPVRDALGAAVPSAGVGCGFSREMLARIAHLRRAEGEGGPFAGECLTEDYELGVLIWREGGKGRFVRARDATGQLVATRAYFPGRLEDSVRQKTRWIHGIALQSWDRLGWSRINRSAGVADTWMALRDRRGPLAAMVLASSYLLVLVELLLATIRVGGVGTNPTASPALHAILAVCLVSLVWRCIMRFLFTAREYGLVEGARAIMRIPVANLVAIVAGYRALANYLRTLRGAAVHWEKTAHHLHPATKAAGYPLHGYSGHGGTTLPDRGTRVPAAA